jgi:hypothetical protein
VLLPPTMLRTLTVNRAVTVKPAVVDDLDVWSQELLKRTVWAGNCRSWYKNGTVNGNITALHAVSAMHYRGMIILLFASSHMY